MANKINITAEEQLTINNKEAKLKELLDTLDKIRQFKVGDYLIWYEHDYQGNWHPHLNSYGAPIKYTVVAVSASGFPFMKAINANGNPVGEMFNGLGSQEFDNDYIDQGVRSRWELDPDYADSLLLQEEYDPAHIHRSKKQIWKEVTNHNKAHKIKTDEIGSIVDFFRTLNTGDLIWTSNVSHYMVRAVTTMPKKDALKLVTFSGAFSNRVKGPFVLVLNVVDKHGNCKDIAADFFFRKALYKQRPRTYKELNL